jgi:hypothetical protein
MVTMDKDGAGKLMLKCVPLRPVKPTPKLHMGPLHVCG